VRERERERGGERKRKKIDPRGFTFFSSFDPSVCQPDLLGWMTFSYPLLLISISSLSFLSSSSFFFLPLSFLFIILPYPPLSFSTFSRLPPALADHFLFFSFGVSTFRIHLFDTPYLPSLPSFFTFNTFNLFIATFRFVHSPIAGHSFFLNFFSLRFITSSPVFVTSTQPPLFSLH
jgi:hypothetical protein